MLESLFESDKKEKILFYLYAHGEGYAREIARTFRFNLNTVQNQLQNLENQGVLYSQMKGKVRIFRFNPRYPFRNELQALLKKAIMYLPEDEVRKYYWPRILHQRGESSAHDQTRRIESSAHNYSFRGGISFALTNPWGKSWLNRFMPLEHKSDKRSGAGSEGSRKK